MTTPLHSTLKRALTIDGREYVITLTGAALKLTLKGMRNGVELSWAQLVNGEAALAVALQASLGAFAAKNKGAAAEAPPAAAARAAKPRPSTRPKPKAKPSPKPQARSAPKKPSGAKRTF
ncbi:MAG TPA: hypothetical protein VHW71_11320 [Steroidobacteraceae bacterium]|jgi:hypothetical protein|nr:hypothetical protein [Steroidobacteraceae bacterium]